MSTRRTVLVLAAILALGSCTTSEKQPTPSLPVGSSPFAIDPTTFTTDITNRYWPMEVGKRWTYAEVDEDGASLTVVVTVTSATKRVASGVTARVVRDTVTEDGEVIEDTFDWYAQDGAGNLWYLGEETAEFEKGAVASREGSWEAGVDGALPGVIVPGDPVAGMRYRQEYYAGHAEDNGEVLSVDEQVEVATGHYTNVLLTKDTITIEPTVLEYKLYAPGVGPALILGVSGGGGREELVKIETVSAAAAAAAGETPLGERYA